MADQSEPTEPTETETEEERLGHRRSWFGRLRNRLRSVAPPTGRANESTRAIGLQGDRQNFHV